jgi:hypothetical protein
MPIHSLDNFTSQFQGGTRPNRFKITGKGAGLDLFGPEGIFCVSASMPESNVGIIPIAFRGRIYKYPGDRSYNDWQVTMLDDTGGVNIWNNWHVWSIQFNDHSQNTSSSRNQQQSMSIDLTIDHLDHASDTPLRTIQLRNAWPVQVGPIQFDMGAANTLTQFSCQIAYSHYEIIKS